MTGKLRTIALAALVCVLAGAATLSGVEFSTAAFTTTSVNTVSTASAAIDWTPPTVRVDEPDMPLTRTATVSATASDAETGVKSVAFAFRAAGSSTWTPLCTSKSAPYQCSWNTTTVADGSYQLRAIATDNSGYSAEHVAQVSVTNSVFASISDPGAIISGDVSLTGKLHNSSAWISSVWIEYAPAGSGSWRTACSRLFTNNLTCSWQTTGVTDGTYDLRTYVREGLGRVVLSEVRTVTVDNTAPTVAIAPLAAPLRSTVDLAATATDGGSGVASVAIEYARTGTSKWTPACTMKNAPYTCPFDTTTLADGEYALRAIATDRAGHTTTSAPLTGAVDNSAVTVILADPGTVLAGRAPLTATPKAAAGVASVTIQYAPAGTSTWTDVCTATASPYTCTWATGTVANGSHDLRAVATNRVGTRVTSPIVAARQIENVAPRGLDVQASNGDAVTGRIDAGDTLTFSYSGRMDTASISSGWNGTATAVTVRVRDANLVGAGNDDTLDVLVGGTPIALGALDLRGDYVTAAKSATLNATMTATSTTIDGAEVTVVQLTLGSAVSGSALRTAPSPGTMRWMPSANATDVAGIRCSTATVNETGASDKEF